MLVSETARECKNVLQRHYGAKFHGIVLYGSYATNQADSSSDIDLLILLEQPFNYFQELKDIVDLLYPLQLETDALISAKPAAIDDFKNGALQLYRNISREGVKI